MYTQSAHGDLNADWVVEVNFVDSLGSLLVLFGLRAPEPFTLKFKKGEDKSFVKA
jgi:hypothetical protein